MKIYAIIEYINRYGKISVKMTTSEEETKEFVAKLKKEYMVTVL